MPNKAKSLDKPVEVLYWVLTPGQRHTIAQRLELTADTDRGNSEIERSRGWLNRARARGSFGEVIKIADMMHRSDLRQIEDTINRFGYRRSNNGYHQREDALMAELQEYRNRHYQWLAYGA